MKNINKQRRQQFLYTELYEAAKEYLREVRESVRGYVNSGMPLDLGAVAEYANDFWCALDALQLEYTAGSPIEEVKAMYPAVVDAFEKWCQAKREWQFNEFPEDRGQVEPTPVELEDIGYQQMMRLFSLGVLLNEGELLRRAHTALGIWRGRDTVIEALVEDCIDEPCDEAEGLFHFDDEQFKNYDKLNNKTAKIKTAAVGKARTLGRKGVTLGCRVALFRYPEDRIAEDEESANKKEKKPEDKPHKPIGGKRK